MTPSEINGFIDSLKAKGSRMDLSGIRALCDEAGHPEKDLKCIHIAGTNGKGSVLAMCESILRSAGYRVGTFSSPALSDERESIRIGGKMISKKDFLAYLAKVSEWDEACDPTWFECMTAVSFVYFKDKNVDLAIYECGMGGRDDATNVIEDPLVCVLSSISPDHVGILGNDIGEIAENKCGIIRKNTYVASAPQDEAVRKKIERICAGLDVSPVFAKEAKETSAKKAVRPGGALSFSYVDESGVSYSGLKLNLTGEYQKINAALALETVGLLRDKYGYGITDSCVREGLADVSWPGRFECISKKPLIYMDGAHNEAGAKALAETIVRDLDGKRLIYIIGILKDKDYGSIVENTCSLNGIDAVITVKPDNPRGMDAYELAKVVKEYNKNVTAAGSVEEALEMARLLAGNDGVVISFGSLSYLGALKSCLERTSSDGGSLRRRKNG